MSQPIISVLEQHPLIGRLFDLATRQGQVIYLVGGSIRDLLLSRPIHDLDIAIDGDGLVWARRVANALGGAYMAMDVERRTGRVLLPPEQGTRFCIDVASLRGDNLEADLRDRDFTINAIAMTRTADVGWLFCDPLGGQDDLTKGILRAAGPDSFAHDPVRTMRAARMSVQFGCEIEAQTEAWLRAAVSHLEQVSAERVRDEWFKILAGSGADRAIRLLDQWGILSLVAPDVAGQADVLLSGHVNGLDDALAVVGVLEQMWAALYCPEQAQIEMPPAMLEHRTQIEQRYKSFVCDERTYLSLLKCAGLFCRLDGDKAWQWARTWRCSTIEAERLRTAVYYASSPVRMAASLPLTRRDIYRFFLETDQTGLDVGWLALARQVGWRQLTDTPPPAVVGGDWRGLCEVVDGLYEAWYRHREEWISPPPLLSGDKVMAQLGLSPGPRVGELLRRLREAVAIGEVTDLAQAWVYLREWAADGRNPTQPTKI